ncbi:MAG TPA: hypothetical protein VLA39_02535 [Marinobacterium sp.]|nr:hypothetical protein [Marinobacterium sp.]
MRIARPSAFIFFILTLPVHGQTLDDLIKREGIYYEESSNVPFSGVIKGRDRGAFTNGFKEGLWLYHHENGSLSHKGHYKNGKRDGVWEGYYANGQLFYKGEFREGVKVGKWESYYDNRKTFYKGEYRDGREEGIWVGFNPDGSVWEYRTGMFKNGVKIKK